MRTPIRLLIAAAAALALGAAPAHAEWLPAENVDGPSADIVGLGGVDIAHDGTGSLVYLKRDLTGVHVFASRLDLGRPTAPVRIDSGQNGVASDARIAVANNGRAIAVWVNAGMLYGSLRASATSAWSPPVLIYGDLLAGMVAAPVLDQSLLGTGFVAFTVGGDVRVARMPYQTGQWTVLEPAVDISQSQTASDPDLAASADGSAVVAWTEAGADGINHVWARRLTDDGLLSAFPREASVRTLSGRPGTNADSPSVSVSDDSSYAFVSVRQDFTDGATAVSRAYGRRLVASKFESAHAIDGLRFPTTDGAANAQIAVGGGADGVAGATLRSGATIGTGIGHQGLLDARFFRQTRLDSRGNTTPPPVTATSADEQRAAVAWQDGPDATAILQARSWNGTGFEPETTLTPASFGPAAGQLGLDSGADSRTELVVAFVQGASSGLRVAVAAFDGILRPAAILGAHSVWRTDSKPKMRWRALTNVVWGPVRYRVQLDGKPLATTSETFYKPRKAIGDGKHVVAIVQIDGRGHESPGADRPIWIDRTKPLVKLKRAGRRYRVSAFDGTSSQGSGVRTLRVVFGRGSVFVPVPASGRVNGASVRGHGRAVRVVAVDKVGNTTSVSAAAASRPNGAR
jgi:hypothetical protein